MGGCAGGGDLSPVENAFHKNFSKFITKRNGVAR